MEGVITNKISSCLHFWYKETFTNKSSTNNNASSENCREEVHQLETGACQICTAHAIEAKLKGLYTQLEVGDIIIPYVIIRDHLRYAKE